MTAAERKQLSGEIAGRYGIRIDENDPAFVVVTLNQHALAKGTAELMNQIDIRFKDFEAAVQGTEARAGKYLAAECREQVNAIRSGLQGDIVAAGSKARELVEKVHRVNTRAILIRYTSVGVLSGLLLFGTGVWVGGLDRMSWNGCAANDPSRSLAPAYERPLQGAGLQRGRGNLTQSQARK